MIVSHKHKFIFIATPKTGSTSIRNILNNFSDFRTDWQHATYRHALNSFDFTKDYTCFAFVRNPWDRCVSNWHYIENRAKTERDPVHDPARAKIFHEYKSFDNYIKYTNGPPALLRPCFHWLSSDGLVVDIDHVCKFENIQQDFDTVYDKIGIPRQKLPYLNKTDHKHYTEYYDDETREIVAKKYAKDIEYFGYKFGG